LKNYPNFTLIEVCTLILKNDFLFEKITTITDDRSKALKVKNDSFLIKAKSFLQEEIMINFFVYVALYHSFLLKKDFSIKERIASEKLEEEKKQENESIKKEKISNSIFESDSKNTDKKEVEKEDINNDMKENASLNQENLNRNKEKFLSNLKRDKEKLLSKFRFNLFICINFLNIFLIFLIYEISLISIIQMLFSFCFIIFHIRKMNKNNNKKDIIVRFEDFWVRDLVLKLSLTILYYISGSYTFFCR